MDVLHSLGIDGKVLIAQMVNFGILLFVLGKFLYTPLLSMLDERKRRIADGLKRAEAAEKRAAEVEEEYHAMLAKAKAEAAEIVDGVKKEVGAMREKLVATTEKEIALLRAQAAEELASERGKMYGQVREHIGKLTLLVITKVLKAEMRDDQAKKSIEKALAEVMK